MIQETGQSSSSSASGPTPVGFRFGIFELDTAAGELRKDGRLTRIRNQPLKVLAILLARPGAIVTREDLYKELWHPEEIVDFDQGLNHSIREIRAILGDNADSPRFIQTLPRRGYRFLAEVRPLYSAPVGTPRPIAPPQARAAGGESQAPEPQGAGAGVELHLAPVAKAPCPPDGAGKEAPHSPRTILAGHQLSRVPGGWGGIAALCTSALALSVWFFQPEPAPPSTPTVPRLLVLPFAAASESTADALIADGLTDEVISRVGRARPGGLTVLGRTSSMEYKGRTTPLSQIRETMEVTYVLEGRVQRTPEGLRAIASLIRAADGARLWTLNDREHHDLQSFQESVAARVSSGVDGTVVTEKPVTRRNPLSVSANLNYLRGRALLASRDAKSLREALAAFEQSVKDEPGFAPAWASIAEALIVLMDHGLVPPAQAWPSVKDATDRALGLDPELAEGWHLLAAYHRLVGSDEVETRRAWERAVSLNPNLVIAHHWNAIALTAAGRLKAAEASIRRAITLDPLAPVLRGNLGDILSAQGRHAEARQQFQIVLDLRPNWAVAYVWMGRALGREGRWAEAVPVLERGASDADGAARAYLVQALARSGNTPRALAILAQMRDPGQPYSAPYYRALAALSLGDRDAAIADLRQTVAERSPMMMKVGYNEDWKDFGDDPRFKRLVDLVTEASQHLTPPAVLMSSGSTDFVR